MQLQSVRFSKNGQAVGGVRANWDQRYVSQNRVPASVKCSECTAVFAFSCNKLAVGFSPKPYFVSLREATI